MYRAWSFLSSIGLAISLSFMFFCGSTRAQTTQNNNPRGQGVVSAQNQQGQTISLYKGSFALVIGVSDYTAGWRNLPGVKQDVEAVSAVLREHGFQVSTVVNPTREIMIRTIEDFISQYGDQVEYRLLIYFAGHGHTESLPDGRERGFLVAADAPRPEKDRSLFYRTAISMDKIEAYALDIQSKHALFVFDSCFSGMVFQTMRGSGPPPLISLKAAQPVRQFITSGTAAQEVPDQSIFRQSFVKGLQGEADLNADGYIVGTELGDYLQAQVTNSSRNKQTPQSGKIRQEKLDQGDFIFVSPKGHRARIAAVTPSAPTPAAMPTINPGWKVVSNGIIVDLSGCKRTRSGVICQFTLTYDLDEDIEVGITVQSGFRQSRLFDESGNEHLASFSQLGSKTGKDSVRLVLVPKIAVKASLRFESVGQTISKISLLRIAFFNSIKLRYVNFEWNADFRDIPITN